MEYRHLTAEHKRRALDEEIARFELDHYRQHLALTTAESMGDERAAGQARANMEALETAIGIRVAARDALGEVSPA